MSDVIRETTMKIERETLSERACLSETAGAGKEIKTNVP